MKNLINHKQKNLIEKMEIKKEETYTSFSNLEHYYKKHRIYFDPSICDKMDCLNSILHSTYENIVAQKSDHSDAWTSEIRRYINPLKKLIEDHFRNLLEPDKGNK